ncbi:MAG TPA: ROK family protein [Casimicrobiaceae bacterium]|jgi:polyphosphate glucokinase|nr:ROK family protein [Casimicrobiaceae bacterium]
MARRSATPAKRAESREGRRAGHPYTLAIDIGGSHIKASVLDRAGKPIAARVDALTPHPAPPRAVLRVIQTIAGALPPFDRISAGFPGVVKSGCIITAPNLGTEAWHAFPLAARLEKQLGKPARVLNDAEMQGLAVIAGAGLECALTFGTGMGSAIYRDGDLMPHLELGQHPAWKSKTYDRYVGADALKKLGLVKWNRRVSRTIALVRTLLNFDHLYLGGGNAAHITLQLPRDVTIVSNLAGIIGGVRLWEARFDRFFVVRRPGSRAPRRK